jgi:anti-anti-sigma factor
LAQRYQEQPDPLAPDSAGSYEVVAEVPGSTAGLVIERQDDGQGVILGLHGEIDIASAPELENALAGPLAVPGEARIVIDLAAVEFIDSTGLATLIEAQARADGNGCSLILRHVPPQAKRLLEITRLAGSFVTE